MPPKTAGAERTIAALLRAQFLRGTTASALYQTAKLTIAYLGALTTHQLTPAHVAEVDDAIRRRPYAYQTKAEKAHALRRILRWLWEQQGAPKLDSQVSSYPGVRPRNIKTTHEEITALLAAAPPHMRLWLLFCSDLAIRSGTAVRLAPENYDPARGELRFTTKANAHMTLPVTAEIAALLERCDQRDPTPFIRQLWPRNPHRHGKPIKAGCDGIDALRWQFHRLCADVGITRSIRPHDMRRATAVAMLEHTKDLRAVQALLGHRNLQSTFWYLDHDLRQVTRASLEIIKRPEPKPREEQSA